MPKEKHIEIKSMSVCLMKVGVKREGPKDHPKRPIAYLTFETALSEEMLNRFGLLDITKDPRFKMGEEIVLSEMKQGYMGFIDLVVAMIQPVTGEAKVLVESVGKMEKMTLSGEIFGFTISYPITEPDEWKVFGILFQDLIGLWLEVTATPDKRGKQEPLLDEEKLKKIGTDLVNDLPEDTTLTMKVPGKESVSVKGKKKAKAAKK